MTFSTVSRRYSFAVLFLLLSGIYMHQANAALIITELNQYTNSDNLLVDVNGDDIDDFIVLVSLESEDDDYAFAWSLSSPEYSYGTTDNSNSINQFNFAMDSSFDINRFNPGDSIGSGWGDWYESGYFFSDYLDFDNSVIESGNWSETGMSGFLGFSFEEADGTHYGWLEVTRGSIALGSMGYQNTAGVSALIPSSTSNPTSVPEPASGALLLLGSLVMLYRRKV